MISHASLSQGSDRARNPAAPPGRHPPAPAPAMLQRAGECSCSGACPRCQAKSLQRKPRVSTPSDAFEQAADATAERVMRMEQPAGGPPRHGQSTRAADNTSASIRRDALAGAAAPYDTDAAVRAAGQGGVALPGAVSDFFEPRFGHDFSSVRVHSDGAAQAGARAVHARAFTLGPDIVFGAGEYAPGTAQGQRLLAHELAHVVQQDAGAGAATELRREALSDDPYPATENGEQPALFSISDEGFDFLKQLEALKNKLYNDSQDHCTIGVGHLVHRGKCDGTESAKFKAGLTDDEGLALFREDLGVYESAVANGVTSRLNQHYFDALVSFAFNIGIGAFQGSGVLRQVNAQNYSLVPAEMMKWMKPPELKNRRTAEARLFRTGQY
jgi:GH24 family phage-related lysozyme (muramidase)